MRCVSLAAAALVTMAVLTPVAASATVIPPPCTRTVSVDNVSKVEGDPPTGPVTPRPNVMSFTLTSSGCMRAGSVRYSVVSTETDEDDHTRPVGLHTWESGDTDEKKINVTITRDTLREHDERLFVMFCPTAGVRVADGGGMGTIINDDGVTLPTPPIVSPNYHCPQLPPIG